VRKVHSQKIHLGNETYAVSFFGKSKFDEKLFDQREKGIPLQKSE
jgi:hypothetical protein